MLLPNFEDQKVIEVGLIVMPRWMKFYGVDAELGDQSDLAEDDVRIDGSDGGGIVELSSGGLRVGGDETQVNVDNNKSLGDGGSVHSDGDDDDLMDAFKQLWAPSRNGESKFLLDFKVFLNPDGNRLSRNVQGLRFLKVPNLRTFRNS